MPDLITHVAISHLIKRPFELSQSTRTTTSLRILLYLGSMIPDILTRPWYILFPTTQDWTLPFHTPLGAFLVCGITALLFEPTLQKRAFVHLAAGSTLHFILDSLQKQVAGNNYWLFPFSWRDFGHGLFWAGEAISIIPIWIALVVLLELFIHFRKKNMKI